MVQVTVAGGAVTTILYGRRIMVAIAGLEISDLRITVNWSVKLIELKIRGLLKYII